MSHATLTYMAMMTCHGLHVVPHIHLKSVKIIASFFIHLESVTDKTRHIVQDALDFSSNIKKQSSIEQMWTATVCYCFAYPPPFVSVNNLDVSHRPFKPSHELSLMRFTEDNGSSVYLPGRRYLNAQVCFHLLAGMGITTVTAARILKGQLAGASGEETSLVMDTFPHLALSKVSLTASSYELCPSIVVK